MASIRATVGQAVVRFLAAQHSERDGVRRRLVPGVWAILGHGNVAGLGQALAELGPALDLPTYRPQNEQAMVHAAAAYAKHANRLATFACTASIGPGSANMLTAAAGATINRLPVLLLPSDIFASRRPDPVLQQLEHPLEHDVSVNDAFRPVSRFFARVDRPEQLLAVLPAAMRVLTDPAETGAVTISLPEDVQAEAWEWPEELFAPRVWLVPRPVPEPEAVAVRDFLDDAWVAVFYHSAAEAIYVDSCQRHLPSARLAQVLSEATGYPVPPEGWVGYPITGDFADYLAGEGVAAVTVELTDHEDPEFERNLAGVQALLAAAGEIAAADAAGAGARLTWLEPSAAGNTGTWQYPNNSFVHPLALEVMDQDAYLLDGHVPAAGSVCAHEPLEGKR